VEKKQTSIEFLVEKLRMTDKEAYAELYSDIEKAMSMYDDELMDKYSEGYDEGLADAPEW
jgi:hypothetical protein